jgi:hypothetical protein
MRRGVVIAAILALALLGPSSSIATAKSSKKALAVAAVKEAVGERYPQMQVGPPAYLNVSGAHISVSCSQLSGSKFKCLWTAGNNLHEHATGGAVVTVYSKGGIARLTNVKCEKPYGHC